MPPKGKPLSDKEIQLLKSWIDQGLPWEAGFTFKVSAYVAPLKPRRPMLPPRPRRRTSDRPDHRRLLRGTQDHAPPAPLEDAAFVRRVYLDLVGQLPALAETEAFDKDAAPDRASV